MRKLASMLVAVVAIGLTTCSQRFLEDLFVIPFATERFVVFVDPDFMKPLISDPADYTLTKETQQQKRNDLKDQIVKLFLTRYGVTIVPSQIVVDVAIAVILNLESAKADVIRQDTTTINSVARDVRVQGRPIQQSPPIIQGRPIQQNEKLTAAGWGLVRRNGYWLSCAAEKAGGTVDGSTRPAKIWIVDTGIAVDNPYLNVDTQNAQNFTVNPPSSNAYDDNGHGTAVAGVAASRKIKLNASMTICSSVSAGAKVVPIKVLDATGGGDWSNILRSLDYIAIKGSKDDVINMSLGDFPIKNCTGEIPNLETTLVNAASKFFVVVAAGNDGDDVMRTVPGCINGPDGTRIYTVASASCGNQCENFSNYGASVDWLAVSNVFTTYLKDPVSQEWTFIATSGTSISSAVISGLIHSTGRAPNRGASVYCNVMPVLPGEQATEYFFGTR